jgi:hypothetical protein
VERPGPGRVGWISLGVAGAAALAAVAVVVAVQRDDGGPSSSRDPVLSDYEPVAGHGGLTYRREEIAGPDVFVTSVGVSVENLVATTYLDDDDLGAVVIYDGAEEVATYDDVRGIALTDPGGTLSAWVEVKETRTRSESDVVAVDASTGEELGRLRVSDGANVTAVRGKTVAISDGDSSRLWTPGSTPEPVRFVPDDHLIVGLTETRVIAADNDMVTTIYDRTTGAEVATLTDLTQWDTNIAGDLLAGATDGGEVRQVGLGTGESTLVDSIVEAATASFGVDDVIVVHDAASFGEPSDEFTADICPQGGACRSMVASGRPLLPNDAIGQFVTQSE